MMKQCKCCGRVYVTERDYLKGTSRWRVCSRGHLYFNCSCESTIIILNGKFDWYSPDKVMSERAASVFNKLAGAETLPRLPEVAIRVQTLLQDENTSLETLTQTVKADPIFAMNVMKTANVSRMPGSAPISTIKEAIRFMGRKRLSELALPAAMVNFEFKTKKYDRNRFWSEAFTTGIVSERLGKRHLSNDEVELAYFAGVFANIGKVVGAILLPEEVDRVYESTTMLTNPQNWPVSEQINADYDHHVLGEIAASLWGLPPELLDSINRHHTPIEDLPSGPDNVKVHHVATFANQLSHLVRLESHRLDEEVFESCLRSFRVSDKQLTEMIGSFERYVEATNDILAA